MKKYFKTLNNSKKKLRNDLKKILPGVKFNFIVANPQYDSIKRNYFTIIKVQ